MIVLAVLLFIASVVWAFVALRVAVGLLAAVNRVVDLLAVRWTPAPMPRSPAEVEANAEIPADIKSLVAANFQSAWAQEDALKTAQETYARLGDWDLVRQSLMYAMPRG